MKIATFNVNSIKARLNNLVHWLEEAKPDIVCLQELKCVDEAFPHEAIEALGYNVAVHGQKTYNGVAILSKFPLEDITKGLPGDDSDEQARYVEAVVSTKDAVLRVASIYLPNGNPVDTEKYPYKLGWMDRLTAHTKELLQAEEMLVLAGDYNVIRTADDCYDLKAWADDALFKIETREKFYELVNLGLTDSFRACHTEPNRYSFWDYQRGSWQKDNGILIDHLLLSPQAADRLTACDIDKAPRGREKPSDHTPVWIELDV
ncbi:MAG: exodeoxyribonuclease III [Rhodobiaceae bacterium]|nr:MAG: exodeoxyribonuclease III [Rhodobiaceae bacterium]